ncbi:MAG: hypothetical protein EXR33_10030 [Betaproteobacteria bacterium]|nr:hypothetical protein [Betaproteobacteria bacterium]
MEVNRSASGDLLLGPPVRERVGQGIIVLVFYALFAYEMLEKIASGNTSPCNSPALPFWSCWG